MPQALMLIQLLCAGFMTGLIWFVQIVHYPLYAHVGPEAWPRYHAQHMRLTTWVVGPVMMIELATAIMLPVYLTDGWLSGLAWVACVLAVLVFLCTALVQVPKHRRLERGHDPRTIHHLVLGNWIRTLAWTLRCILLGAIYLHMSAPAT